VKALMSSRFNFAIGFNDSITKADATIEITLSTTEPKIVPIGNGYALGEVFEEFRFCVGRKGLDSLIESLTERRRELHEMEKLIGQMEFKEAKS